MEIGAKQKWTKTNQICNGVVGVQSLNKIEGFGNNLHIGILLQ